MQATTTRRKSASEELCLLGPRQLSSHLELLERAACTGPLPSPSELAHSWRGAAAAYRRLEVSESGAADEPDIRALPAVIERHVGRLIEQPGFRDAFDTVPVAFGMVELDKMIVSQYTLTRSIVDRLRARHAPRPTPRQLAQLCLPMRPRLDDCALAYRGEREFAFVSGAHDLRFLAAGLVDPARLEGLRVPGHATAIVALCVGFSTNVLNVVRLGNRVVLNNGHHRAYALRAMGLTHVPCVIQVCASHEELRQAGSSEICENSDLYYESPRPPLLRDFSRPELACALGSASLRRQVRIKFEVESREAAV